MSLMPLYLNDKWYAMRPSRIMDQHFGMGLDLDDFGIGLNVDDVFPSTHPFRRCPAGYYRHWRSTAAKNDAGSTVRADKDKFHVDLDVQQFTPEEITVKTTGNNTITVEGKHEEKQDEHGFISRQFLRRYVLPEGHDASNVVSNLSSDGVLSISAPRVDQVNNEHRPIPIQQTGVPIKAVLGEGEENQAQKQERYHLS